jgi:hypothetical protein
VLASEAINSYQALQKRLLSQFFYIGKLATMGMGLARERVSPASPTLYLLFLGGEGRERVW